MVVTARPRASAASTRQDATRRPSSSTEQAPQSPVAHPSFVPVRPSRSRSAASRLSGGSQRNSADSPLIVVSMCSFVTIGFPADLRGPPYAFGRFCHGPFHQHTHDLPPIGNGSPLVVDRPCDGPC